MIELSRCRNNIFFFCKYLMVYLVSLTEYCGFCYIKNVKYDVIMLPLVDWDHIIWLLFYIWCIGDTFWNDICQYEESEGRDDVWQPGFLDISNYLFAIKWRINKKEEHNFQIQTWRGFENLYLPLWRPTKYVSS